MRGEVVKFPIGIARRGKVFCKPLNIYFPQIYRLVRKRDALISRVNGVSVGDLQRNTICDYSLTAEVDTAAGVIRTVEIDHLSQGDDASLIIHHFWSMDHAIFYAKSAEDHFRDQPSNAICENQDGIFTMTKCPTHPGWGGPTIFYLADGFEDDAIAGFAYWEASAGSDGVLRHDEIFYETD